MEIKFLNRGRNSVKTLKFHTPDSIHSYFEPFVKREKSAEKQLQFFLLHFLLHNSLRWLGVSSTYLVLFFGPNKRAVGEAESVFCPWQLRTGHRQNKEKMFAWCC